MIHESSLATFIFHSAFISLSVQLWREVSLNGSDLQPCDPSPTKKKKKRGPLPRAARKWETGGQSEEGEEREGGRSYVHARIVNCEKSDDSCADSTSGMCRYQTAEKNFMTKAHFRDIHQTFPGVSWSVKCLTAALVEEQHQIHWNTEQKNAGWWFEVEDIWREMTLKCLFLLWVSFWVLKVRNRHKIKHSIDHYFAPGTLIKVKIFNLISGCKCLGGSFTA